MDEQKLMKKIDDIKKGVNNRSEKGKINYSKIIYSKFPDTYKRRIEEEADYAGIKVPIHKYVTNIMQIAAMVEVFVLVVLIIFFNLTPFFIGVSILLALGVNLGSPYFLLTLLSENNKKSMEKVLPDLLVLVASNIRSGQTIEKALLFSAREEFGSLAHEIKKTAIKIYGGVSIGDALINLSTRIKSFTFKRTVNLLTEGLKTGGDISVLLDESASDIRNTETLLKEISTSVQMMVMFIFIAGVIASPAMFAISNYLVFRTSEMWSGIDSSALEGVSSSGSMMSYFTFSQSSITPDFFNTFSIWAILITTIFGGLLVSQIKKGNIKDAVKYSPIFSVIALGIYFSLKAVMFKVLGSTM